jgi:hypothetical protein
MSAILVPRAGRPFPEEVAASQAGLRRGLDPSLAALGSGRTWAEPTAMLQAYQRTGGLAGSDEVMFLLRRRTSQPISLLARWIVVQHVVSFEWKTQRLLPLFQFDSSDMSVRSSVSAVLEELSGTFDNLEIASWFAEPNSWLQQELPLNVLEVDRDAVLHAARADRYIARG